MKVYHMSDTLQLGMVLSPDYKEQMELTQPFVQALERSEDCFYAMLLNAKYLRAVLKKFGLMDMQTNYTKWATEGIFEYVRKTEFPHCCCRLTGNYFFDDLENCRELFEVDWGNASPEERSKIKLYEVELEDSAPEKYDMRLFDEAFDAMWEHEDIQTAFQCARRYFNGDLSGNPMPEILSEQKAVAVAERSDYLIPEKECLP